ncbi:glycosyl transferase [Knoellia sinensis KCTC 19936]|uniref:Glycosyl transferase n=1 Tax=Knoellia sinensis KCTC 19936 TaxID=1385520 RepID=A0A0A0JCK6_9MICO|nr:sugar transferase [Knoellia sinensis]KGN34898.1 glycosyl transferase [Knoellia sinensis KCTC 19936]
MRQRLLVGLACADAALLFLAFVIAAYLQFDSHPFSDAVLAQTQGRDLVDILVMSLLGSAAGSLLVTGLMPQGPPRPTYSRAALAALLAFLAITAQIVLARPYYSRPHLFTTLAIWLGLVLLLRLVLRLKPWTERLLIVTNSHGIVRALDETPHITVVGVIDPGTDDPPGAPPADTILTVDLSAPWSREVTRYVSATSVAGREVRQLNDVYEEHTGRVPLGHLSEGWEIETSLLRKLPFLPFKHALDLVLVVLTSPLWMPLIAIVAVLVRIFDGSPVIFRQVRVGRRGELVELFKFRTMRADAESQGARQATGDDPRITPLGKFLRSVRLDELPQFFNVLRGELSLIGPRPEQVSFVEKYREAIPFYDQRHLVRPGITGWAQVRHGYAASEEETIEKLSYDFYYLKHMSPLLDLEVFARSIWTIASASGTKPKARPSAEEARALAEEAAEQAADDRRSRRERPTG